MSRARILIAEDKESMLRLLVRILGDAHEVVTAADGTAALARLSEERFDAVLTDIRMPGADGFAVLRAAKARAPGTEVIMLTGFASIPAAVEAIRLGAYDYIPKPFDPDDLALVVARALERKRLVEQVASLPNELADRFGFGQMVGRSAPMQEVYDLLERAAGLDVPVLLSGPAGSGKTLAARAIHAQSVRKTHPFTPVKCGALPTERIETELFGAASSSGPPGLLEQAHSGTVLLAEIDALPPAVQARLALAIEERELGRAGRDHGTRLDVRLIVASRCDLKAEVASGRFREDLFYRLNVFLVRLPALSERREDIPLLAAHFLDRHTTQNRLPARQLSADSLRVLTAYGWPGNVRELESAMARAAVVARGEAIEIGDLPAELRSAAGTTDAQRIESLSKLPYREAVREAHDRVARDYLVSLLRELSGNVTRAAARAGMERESLHRLLKRFGIRSDDFKKGD